MNSTRTLRLRSAAVVAALVVGLAASIASQQITLPQEKGSFHFAVVGDTGTGTDSQYRIAQMLTAARAKFPFDMAIMLGDNIYGSDTKQDMVAKFEKPYQALTDGGVKFYASLGNHDNPNQAMYKPFSMNGERYYTFKPTPLSNVRFFALDSNYMDPKQLEWLEKELAASKSEWKIAFFHHPLYASGQHGSDLILRGKLEPMFLKYSVDVVFSGHEHFYERIKPQNGIQYFVEGGSAKLRKGDIDQRTGLTAKGFDTGYSFMLIEVAGDKMYFQTISDKAQTIDSGVIARRNTPGK